MFMTQFNNDLSKEIFETTYRYGEETLEQTQYRVAHNIASVEDNVDYWTDKFIDVLKDFKFVPGGRILSNAGIGLKGTTYINCFVDGFVGKDKDSMRGISEALSRQALILKSEGGYGFCADVLRPKGGFIEGIANETPGAVRMLDMWNTQSFVITHGSGKKSEVKKSKQKIRKGAQMVTLSCWHPDVEEFITAKQTSGRLDKFNMSVLITDAFMDAVINNKKWELIFPDFDKVKGIYEDEWDGNINKWIEDNHPVKVYKTYKNANDLWNLIMNSTYNRNEPGVLFIDTINRFNNLYWLEYISATNPCVVGNTLIYTNIGWIKIKNLKRYKNIKIITSDKDLKLFESELKWVDITVKNDDIYRVNFSNSEFLLTNKKHKFYKSDFSEISVEEILLENKKVSVIGGYNIVDIINIEKLDYKEDVYDLTANPNYNFFTILNHEEIIIKDFIIVNDNIKFNYFDLVNTDKGQKFACDLLENDNIL